jgi:hypothetical protein
MIDGILLHAVVVVTEGAVLSHEGSQDQKR